MFICGFPFLKDTHYNASQPWNEKHHEISVRDDESLISRKYLHQAKSKQNKNGGPIQALANPNPNTQ